jgi:hypothetical protein
MSNRRTASIPVLLMVVGDRLDCPHRNSLDWFGSVQTLDSIVHTLPLNVKDHCSKWGEISFNTQKRPFALDKFASLCRSTKL